MTYESGLGLHVIDFGSKQISAQMLFVLALSELYIFLVSPFINQANTRWLLKARMSAADLSNIQNHVIFIYNS